MRAAAVQPRTLLLLPCRPTAQWRWASFHQRPHRDSFGGIAPNLVQRSLTSKCNVHAYDAPQVPHARAFGLHRGLGWSSVTQSFPSGARSITSARKKRLEILRQNEERRIADEKIYRDITSKITDEPRDKLISEKILAILSAVRRPLRRTELEAILSLTIEKATANELQSFINANVSRGFVIGRDDGSVRIENKIRGYLSSNRHLLGWPAFEHHEIAKLLINYLCDKTLAKLGPCNTKNEWQRRETDYPLLLYAASSWIYHLAKARDHHPSLVKDASPLWTTRLESTYGVWLQAAFMDKKTAAGGLVKPSVLDIHDYQTAIESSTLQTFSKNGSKILTTWLRRIQSSDYSDLRVLDQEYFKGVELLNRFGSELQDALRTTRFTNTGDLFKLQLMFQIVDIQELVNQIDSEGETLLHAVVKCSDLTGDLTLLNQILKHNPAVNVYGKVGYTPLHYAALRGSVDLVKALLAAGADPKGGLPYLTSALHCACGRKTAKKKMKILEQQRDALEVIKLLIQAGADPTAVDGDGVTPLTLAAMNDFDEIVAYLFKFYSTDQINAVGRWGTGVSLTALTAAIICGARKNIVRGLLNRGGTGPPGTPTIPIQEILENADTISHGVIKFLCQKYPDSMKDTRSGQSLITRLFANHMHPQPKILDYVISLPKERNSIFENYQPYEESTLQRAARNGLASIILNFASSENTTELGQSLPWNDIWNDICTQDVKEAQLHRFLALRPEFNTVEYLKEGLLKSLASNSSLETLLFYLNKLKPMFEDKTCPPPWKLKDEETGNTILHFICRFGLYEFYLRLKYLYPRAVADNIDVQNKDGLTPLMMCFILEPVKNMHSGLVRSLLDYGINLTVRDNEGQTALIHAIRSERFEYTNDMDSALRLLLNKDLKKETLKISDSSGLLPMDHACLINDVEVTRTLRKYGAKLRLKDDNGRDLFPRMKLRESKAIAVDSAINEMIEIGADINYVNSKGENFLFNALRAGSVSLVRKLLLEYKFDPTKPLRLASEQVPGETYLGLPFLDGCKYSSEMALALLRYATPKQRRDLVHGRSQDGRDETPLHFFMRHPMLGVVRALIEAGADVNAVDAEGRTPLWYANKRGSGLTLAEGGQVEAVTAAYYLLQAGADPKYRNPMAGQTIFEHIAKEEGFDLKVPALELLAQHGGLDKKVDSDWAGARSNPGHHRYLKTCSWDWKYGD
ncbi:Tankyrase-1 [Arthrobotrys entomopaga]|nr:Tankyrase-1 [Arthrobotrys entomopaga]